MLYYFQTLITRHFLQKNTNTKITDIKRKPEKSLEIRDLPEETINKINLQM